MFVGIAVFHHRTKSYFSVFLKRGVNMQFHGSVIFKSRGNVKIKVLRNSVTFPERTCLVTFPPTTSNSLTFLTQLAKVERIVS